VGWSRRGQSGRGVCACSMAGIAKGRHLPAAATFVVCQHGQGICHEGGRYRGAVFESPENALVISVDEKPSIQALERATGYVETDNSKIVRGFKSTYKRHGTLNLFAALQVATGRVTSQITETKRREDFLGFMDAIVAETPADKELHVILDNYCTHKKCDAWLEAHPNVHFHFTPTSASWLNQVEIWFSILSRKALRGASFSNIQALRQAIEDFVAVYNPTASPFRWRKREVRGSQLRNTIVNLRS